MVHRDKQPFVYTDKRGRLQAPRQTHTLVTGRGMARYVSHCQLRWLLAYNIFSEESIASAPSTSTSGRSSQKRRRGKHSSEQFRIKQNKADDAVARARKEKSYQKKQLHRMFKRSDLLTVNSYSVLGDGNVSKTGWHGAPPPRRTRKAIRSRYNRNIIQKDLTVFMPVSYNMG